jgi:hypothetical protein
MLYKKARRDFSRRAFSLQSNNSPTIIWGKLYALVGTIKIGMRIA